VVVPACLIDANELVLAAAFLAGAPDIAQIARWPAPIAGIRPAVANRRQMRRPRSR